MAVLRGHHTEKKVKADIHELPTRGSQIQLDEIGAPDAQQLRVCTLAIRAIQDGLLR